MRSFEELDYQETALGALELRRRRPPSMPGTWVYEVKLAGRFLMSSLNHSSEEALADRGLEFLAQGASGPGTPPTPWRVMVGGLGLGHTAAAALRSESVGYLEVVELLPEVIRWHRATMVPMASTLVCDPRCQLVQGDALHRLRQPGEGPWDAVLIDIDDSPEHLLDDGHGAFYTRPSLTAVRNSLVPGGVLAVWASLPMGWFADSLREVFGECEVHDAVFHNTLLMADEVNPIYLARRTW